MPYFIAIEGQQRGPFPVEELLAQGLRPETLVWTEGMSEWRRADSVEELRALLADPRHAVTQPPPEPSGHSHSPNAPVAPPPAPPPQPTYGHPAYGQGVYHSPGVPPQYSQVSTNRLAAGICGILLGSLGIHKFILGFTQAGLIMLLATMLTCGIAGLPMSIIGIIEGVIYLTKSDEEFYRTYVVGKKDWF